jgi:uncharacterized cupredoxin-like copper-binding protein
MTSIRARRRAAGGAAAALLGLASGCGGAVTTVPAGAAVALTLREYRIDPQQLRTSAGRVTFAERNTGVLVHELRVAQGDQTIALLPPLRPGQSATLTMALRPGRYQLSCAVAGHAGLGERGELVVR